MIEPANNLGVCDVTQFWQRSFAISAECDSLGQFIYPYGGLTGQAEMICVDTWIVDNIHWLYSISDYNFNASEISINGLQWYFSPTRCRALSGKYRLSPRRSMPVKLLRFFMKKYRLSNKTYIKVARNLKCAGRHI